MGLFFFFCILKGELRQWSMLIIFLVCHGDHGVSAPLATPRPAVFAADNTGEESGKSWETLGKHTWDWEYLDFVSLYAHI